MNPKLFELLRTTCKLDINHNDYTHFTYYNPSKCWTVRSTSHTEFWKEYCKLAYESINDNVKMLCLAEKPNTIMPVIALFRFQFSVIPDVSANDYINDQFIIKLVKSYQEAIRDNFILAGDGIELICCVLEPENGEIEDNIITVNLRLQFPYCKMDTTIQNRIIRPKVIEILRRENFRSDLATESINTWEESIDPMVFNEPLPLYRSTTTADDNNLICSHIYPNILEYDDYNDIPEYGFKDVFKFNYVTNVQNGLINQQLFDDIVMDDGKVADIEIWMPLFLSINYFQMITQPKESINEKTLESLQPVNTLNSSNNNILKNRQNENIEENDIDIAENLVNMLSDKRSRDENYWLDVGRALYNSDNEYNGRGYKLWLSFSERGNRNKYDCDRYWDSFEIQNSITVKTIAFYARKDNPRMYKSWHSKKYTPYLIKATSMTDTDLAIALYWVYWIDFTCSVAARGGSWHVYKNHRWIDCDDGIELLKEISSNFRHLFDKLQTELTQEKERSFDDNVKDKNSKIIDKVNKLTIKLKNGAMKRRILNEAREHFKDNNFNKYINANPSYFGLPNGVIETCSDRAVFRNGKPEDYITLSSYVRYHTEYTWDHPLVQEFMLWMRQCFTDPALLEYVLCLVSSFMRSGNLEKIFPCMTGSGDNSKSMFKKVLELIFGSYAFTFSTDTLMSRNAPRANQQKALARFCKIVFAQEPDNDSKFKNGIIKEFTGMDKIYGSLLYDNGGDFEVLFVLILVTNKMPIIPGADKALINRLRSLPFLSERIENAPTDLKEQFEKGKFKVDRLFSQRIPAIAPAGLWVLVQKYADYKKNGLVEPEAVSKATRQYWEESDIYLHFTKECIDHVYLPNTQTSENPKGQLNMNMGLTVPEAYNSFRFWIRDTYPDIKVPNQPEMKLQLGQRWGKPMNDCWRGVQIKQMAADINMSGFNYYNKP